MVALYPNSLDSFREHLAGFDYMQRADLDDLFDVAAQLQAAVGILPSGKHGTVSARLFENGNLSQRAAGWLRLLWSGDQGVAQSIVFSHNPTIGGGFQVNYPAERMEGHGSDRGFGEGVPAPFGALQGPVTSGSGSNSRGGVPWRSMAAEVDEERAKWVALDGENATLSTSNTLPCRWGYILWNLKT